MLFFAVLSIFVLLDSVVSPRFVDRYPNFGYRYNGYAMPSTRFKVRAAGGAPQLPENPLSITLPTSQAMPITQTTPASTAAIQDTTTASASSPTGSTITTTANTFTSVASPQTVVKSLGIPAVVGSLSSVNGSAPGMNLTANGGIYFSKKGSDFPLSQQSYETLNRTGFKRLLKSLGGFNALGNLVSSLKKDDFSAFAVNDTGYIVYPMSSYPDFDVSSVAHQNAVINLIKGTKKQVVDQNNQFVPVGSDTQVTTSYSNSSQNALISEAQFWSSDNGGCPKVATTCEDCLANMKCYFCANDNLCRDISGLLQDTFGGVKCPQSQTFWYNSCKVSSVFLSSLILIGAAVLLMCIVIMIIYCCLRCRKRTEYIKVGDGDPIPYSATKMRKIARKQ